MYRLKLSYQVNNSGLHLWCVCGGKGQGGPMPHIFLLYGSGL
jgi:hypothetical protein